jgi:hypothetical protein
MPTKTGIVCPMCSHINPTTNIYCDNCQARLVPAAAPSAEEPEAPHNAAAPIKKALSLPTKSAADLEPEQSDIDEVAEADETPDWLQNLRKAVPKASERRPGSGRLGGTTAEESGSEEDLPDWMRTNAPEDQDWFQRLSSTVVASQRGAAPAQPVQEEEFSDGMSETADLGAEDVPDWLSRMRSETPADESEAETLPDWLSESETDTTVEPSADAQDWLAGLRSVAPTEETTDETTADAVEELPDWLSGLADDAQQESLSEAPASGATHAAEELSDELPDWMRDMEAAAQAEPEAAVSSEDDASDWLAGLRTAAPETESEEAEETGDTLDWLSELSPLEPEAAASSSEEAPDWLKDFSSAPPAAREADEAETETDEVPDWMSSLSAMRSAVAEVEEEEGSIEPGETPDWLQDLRTQAPETETPAPRSFAFLGVDEGLLETEATPDWLTAAEQGVSATETEIPLAAEPAEVPDWLRDLGPLPQSTPSETPFGEAPVAEAGDIPEWLRGVQPAARGDMPASPFQAAEEEVDSAGLTAATIPSWLEALRPAPQAEPVAEAIEEVQVESEGLLAGLKSVLPAAALMAQAVDEPVATRMQMSGVDAARAGLLQELLSRGSVAPLTVIKPGLGARARARDWVTRIVILALFVALIALPVGELGAFTKELFQLRQLGDTPYAGAKQLLDGLPNGSRVLVSFDYEASQAGEMEEVARALLTHLQQRGAQIDAVGLDPTGIALASRVAERVPDLLFANVNYLPGQAAGAQSALRGAPPDLLVVLAGSPEAMRVWVEQAALVAPQTQVLAGLSAGAWSQVQPYVQSGQVRAELTGAMAALAYQRVLDPASDAGPNAVEREKYSEALFLSQIAFAMLLALGGVISLVTRPRRAN